MAHFARIDGGTVAQVIVVNNDVATDEATGQAFIASLGLEGEWVQTSYTGSIRGKFAGIGDEWTGTEFVEQAETFTQPELDALVADEVAKAEAPVKR